MLAILKYLSNTCVRHNLIVDGLLQHIQRSLVLYFSSIKVMRAARCLTHTTASRADVTEDWPRPDEAGRDDETTWRWTVGGVFDISCP